MRELSRRGHSVSSIKLSHHEWDADQAEGKISDTARHQAAGAVQVAFAGSKRWTILDRRGAPDAWHNRQENHYKTLVTIIDAMAAVDLILVEGYKSAPIPKIEVRRMDQSDRRSLAGDDPYIFAVAADHLVDASNVWSGARDDVEAIAGLLEGLAGLPDKPHA